MSRFQNSSDVLVVSKRPNAKLDLMTMFINGGPSELQWSSEKNLVKFVKNEQEAVVSVTPAPYVF